MSTTKRHRTFLRHMTAVCNIPSLDINGYSQIPHHRTSALTSIGVFQTRRNGMLPIHAKKWYYWMNQQLTMIKKSSSVRSAKKKSPTKKGEWANGLQRQKGNGQVTGYRSGLTLKKAQEILKLSNKGRPRNTSPTLSLGYPTSEAEIKCLNKHSSIVSQVNLILKKIDRLLESIQVCPTISS